MKLRRLKVERATSCGGLLDGLDVDFDRPGDTSQHSLSPRCLIGPNGSGKSQFLQLLAEIFQAAWNAHSPAEERDVADKTSLFSLEYAISPQEGKPKELVRLSRTRKGNKISPILMETFVDLEWQPVKVTTKAFGERLPSLIVGYTSGDNETLSLPFFVSRSGYSADVREAALPNSAGIRRQAVSDNRLLLIDYSTHLEVLVANLLLGDEDIRRAIIGHANLTRLASFRCVIQLNHLTRLKARTPSKHRKGVQLTQELESYIDALKSAATCWQYDEAREIYTFDVLVDGETEKAFRSTFSSSIDLYKALHKLALLNDLAIPKSARDRLKREMETRRFASRLPEPQDEEKIFRFEQVRFHRHEAGRDIASLDYVSLSDGEHQQAQIFGVFAMITQDNALFILDEPESHFNPLWRVQFVKRLLELPVVRRGAQEVLMTSHAPFVPSDLHREQVHIFRKNADGVVCVAHPDIETYGATFDRILDHCFGVSPPISQLARDKIDHLMREGTAAELEEALQTLGASVEKAFLADKLIQLEEKGEDQ